jgi:hypothetical protein
LAIKKVGLDIDGVQPDFISPFVRIQGLRELAAYLD